MQIDQSKEQIVTNLVGNTRVTPGTYYNFCKLIDVRNSNILGAEIARVYMLVLTVTKDELIEEEIDCTQVDCEWGGWQKAKPE